MASRVVMVESISDWDGILKQAKSQDAIIVAHFSADWCAPCKYMASTFREASTRFLKLIFLTVDVDELKEIATRLEVKAMPTFVFIKDEEAIGRIVGANREQLVKRVAALATTVAE
ncbi:hypothetical protein SELMODRAFT_438048 [Selaginella moellendorffii]|uniref:Thioredoxin domain-containing protein n=1 Tax=Selaginella moellendorffii TaxID=88036 RepID=D8QT25_SELML|nr:thioredoxin-like protein CXXS1 [Selaginella moellendorffii]XP_002964847.1 thioredoxin-like protein CXXS1 [Selaginella moellendorffii]EFJ33685.1 hypothetical protein SELMODRAFT_83714 [Selaginella moellendorffii]EFJ37037.1 hypothetical protein SELMODRAFT_438048 [Selaginella moellendorffii]|eukprot:XP_002961777.1 thioredoxin-like protein CXXS1 [Selaginella moellendorffii]